MGLLNSLANGLSQAGTEAGKFFGTAGLETIKKQLEEDKIRLADQLAGARQERGFVHEKDMIGEREKSSLRVKQGELDISTDPENVRKSGEAKVGLMNAVLPAEVERQKQFSAVEVQSKVDEFTKLAPLKRQEAIEAAVAQVKAMATPEMLKASRDIALSKHIVDPSYSAVPESDGTVTLLDTKSGRTKKMVDADGKPIIRKDPEELKAATAVLTMVNADLRVARAEHQTSLQSAMGDQKATAVANAEWQNAQEKANRLVAPAMAVLYGKAKISDVGQPAPSIGNAADAGNNRPPLSSFGKKQTTTASQPKSDVMTNSTADNGSNNDEFDRMVRDAKRGGSTGKNYLRTKLAEQTLTAPQRILAESLIGTR